MVLVGVAVQARPGGPFGGGRGTVVQGVIKMAMIMMPFWAVFVGLYGMYGLFWG